MDITKETLDPNFKFKIIKPEALTTIRVSTAFYYNLKELFYFLIKDKTQEEITDAIKQINEEKIKDEWVYHYKTLFILTSEIEKKAEEAGDMVEKTKEEIEEYLKKIVS